jgi:hypothetical protein
VVPFLGAGANLCDRRVNQRWRVGRVAPSGYELAGTLAERSRFPDRDLELLRVAQFVDAVLGEGQLYRYLHTVFDADYPPTSLHRLLARLPGLLREAGHPQLLLLTTNYDDLIERSLEAAGEPYDVVWYEAKHGPMHGRFIHRQPDGEVVPIEVPNEYTALDLENRPVVLKLHGAIDRVDFKRDSYVITEDSYIDYLVGGFDVSEQIPFLLLDRMEESHFLFLGYSMRDWNLRVILKRIWGARQLDLKSWAVQRAPKDAGAREVEEALWRDRGDVDLLYVPLKEYVARLAKELFGPESAA